MTTIESLKQQISEADDQLAGYRKKLDGPESFAYELSIRSIEYRLSQLQTELQSAYVKRESELLQIRLKGKRVDFGQIPLGMLAALSGKLSDAIHASSAYLKRGVSIKGRKFPDYVVKPLDLRLVGIEQGSTRLLISGKHSPDLFGQSMLASSLESIFELIGSGDESELASAVDTIGIKGTEYVRDFLKTLTAEEIAIEMKWNSPSARPITWSANRPEIRRLVKKLEHIEHQKRTIEFYGVLVGLSQKGNFELLSQDGGEYEGKYPQDIYKTVRRFRIGDKVWARVQENTYTTEATGVKRKKYNLETLRKPEEHERLYSKK